MTSNTGAHESRDLETGETVHLVRHPGSKWRMSSYDWSWTNGLMLWTAQVFAQKLGWENLEFDTPGAAYGFVEQQLKEGKIPSKGTQHRAAFAKWLAREHLVFDKRLTLVVYLPGGAPEDEVRLLEVNTGLYPEPGNPIVPVETTPAVTDLQFRVWVADVTPDEWDQIQANPGLLPPGWSLEGRQTIRRAQ